MTCRQRSPRVAGYYGFITLHGPRHYRPCGRYSLKMQAGQSAGVHSIALTPEEDHDVHDNQQDQAVRTLRLGHSHGNWRDDGGTAGSRGWGHRHRLLRTWLELRKRPAEPWHR